MNSNTNKDQKEDIQERVSKDAGKDQKSRSKSRKARIFIAGDSMVRELTGWLMSINKSVKVYSFSGATADDMERYLSVIRSLMVLLLKILSFVFCMMEKKVYDSRLT